MNLCMLVQEPNEDTLNDEHCLSTGKQKCIENVALVEAEHSVQPHKSHVCGLSIMQKVKNKRTLWHV